MSFKVTWLGHAAFAMEIDGYKVLLDPFLTGNPVATTSAKELEADFILVSHGHGDHVGDAVQIAKRNDATCIANAEISSWLTKQGVPHIQSNLFSLPCRQVAPGLGNHIHVQVHGMDGSREKLFQQQAGPGPPAAAYFQEGSPRGQVNIFLYPPENDLLLDQQPDGTVNDQLFEPIGFHGWL